MIRYTLPDYRPDQSAHSGYLTVAENVLPAPDGYAPMGSINPVSEALTGTFNGGFSAIGSDGTAYLLAGTATNLYKLTSGAWSSLVGSLTISARWRFTQFGDYVVAVNGSATREIDLSTGTQSTISGAPTGTCVTVIGDYVVIGQSNSEIATVRWSAFRDHTGWTNGTDQAGEQPQQTGGKIMGLTGGEYGIILQRERLVRMTRTGDAQAPFAFDEVSANFGCADPATVAQAGRSVFFYSDRGFMALDDGQALRPIGTEKVDKAFAEVVSRADLDTLFSAVDPEKKLVFWGAPGTPGTVWIYNFELDKWATGTFAFSGIFPGFTNSVTLEELAVTYTDLDAMTISLDDPFWSGGAPRLYFVDADNKLGPLTGVNLAARVDTPYLELVQGRRARVRNVRPVTDAVSGLSMQINARARLGDLGTEGTWTHLTQSGIVPLRASGRYLSTSLRIEAGTTWSYLQALEFEAEPGGLR